MPVIVLGDCNVFPHALLPLNIFEPRYRAMLDTALRHHRFMGVATLRETGGDAWDESDGNIEPYSCAGLLRACVGQPDGTSRLILQGVRRVRIVSWEQREPFRVARIERVPSVIADAGHAGILARRVYDCVRSTLPEDTPFRRQFDRQFGELHDPCLLADVIGYNFLSCARLRQPLLGLSSVEERLEYLLDHLAKP